MRCCVCFVSSKARAPKHASRRRWTSRSLTYDTATANSSQSPRQVQVYSSLDGPPIDYVKGWAWQTLLLQQQLLVKRQQQTSTTDTCLFFEHSPVYTLGRGANLKHLTFLQENPSTATQEECIQKLQARGPGSARLELPKDAAAMMPTNETVQNLLAQMLTTPVVAPNGVPVYRVERGGEVTFHGPGQLVVYPMLDLLHYKQDLRWYLHQVEQVIIDTLQTHYNLECTRDPINTGVWVGENKIAAVGVAASRWTTTHGFCINVDPDLSWMEQDAIVPCGLEGRGVTSLHQVSCYSPSVQEVARHVMDQFQRTFGVTFVSNHTRIR